jgi:4-amino-4-deoxy-L-arabinose transferase-like glycosyltransferase
MLRRYDARPFWDNFEYTEQSLATLGDDGRKNASGPLHTASYPPLYYMYGAIAYRLSPDQSALGRLTAVRLAGVVLFLATVLLAWLIAAELFSAVWLRTLVTGIVALFPKFASLGATINPDIMLIAATTAFIYFGLRLLRHGLTLGRTLAVSAAAGAGVLCHARGLALVAPAAFLLLVAAWRGRSSIRKLLKVVAPALVLFGVLAAVAVVWTGLHTKTLTVGPGVGGGGAFGGQAEVVTGADFNLKQFLVNVWQFYLPKLSFMSPRIGPAYGYREVFIESYFGRLGSFDVSFQPVVIDALQVAVGAGLIVLFAAVVARARELRARWAEVAFAVITVVSTLALLHIFSFNFLRSGSGDPVITGRYLIPLVALYAAAIGFICSSLPKRLGVSLGGALLAVSALFTFVTLAMSFTRFYV